MKDKIRVKGYNGLKCYECEEGFYEYNFTAKKFICKDCRHELIEILGFFGEYRFLSNFFPSQIEYENVIYPTVEHAYQASKTLDKAKKIEIALLETPGKAKRMGQKITPRNSWHSVSLERMELFVMKKFSEHPKLCQKLLDTGDIYIEETNNWNDTFWGVCSNKGHNHLGEIIMKVRKNVIIKDTTRGHSPQHINP